MGTTRPVRQIQDRPQREDQKVKELRLLKGENHRLQRQLARANRKIEKMSGAIDSLGRYEEVEESPQPTREEKDRRLEQIVTTLADLEGKKEPEGPKCPQCGSSELVEVPAGPKTVTICRECKWRTTSQFQ